MANNDEIQRLKQAKRELELQERELYSEKEEKRIKQYQDNIHFAAMVESVDESLGRVIEKLKDLNLEKNTIVIFFSDIIFLW